MRSVAIHSFIRHSSAVLISYKKFRILFDLSALELTYLLLAAALVGFSKTSVGGVNVLSVVLVALAFPGKASTGVLLPMLIVADIMAVIYYRRDCQWPIIVRLLPLTLVGIVIGYFIVTAVPVDIFEKLIGLIILAMLFFNLALDGKKTSLVSSKLFTGGIAAVAGAASMIANSAGPIFGLYLLHMGLKKEQFVGTRSWFFLIMNMIKVPFSAHLGLITTESLKLNLACVPIILLGAFIGVRFLKMINLSAFTWLIRVAVLISAVRLIAY